MNSTDDGTTAE